MNVTVVEKNAEPEVSQKIFVSEKEARLRVQNSPLSHTLGNRKVEEDASNKRSD